MLDHVDEPVLHVLACAAAYAAARSANSVEPQDIFDALLAEHSDLVGYIFEPMSISAHKPEPRLGPAIDTVALLISPDVKTLLGRALTEASNRVEYRWSSEAQGVTIEVRDLIIAALINELSHNSQQSDEVPEGRSRLRRDLDLSLARGRLQLFSMDGAFDNWITPNLEHDKVPEGVIGTAVQIAARAGSARVEPPHLLRALVDAGPDMIEAVTGIFSIDVDALPLRTGEDADYVRGAAGSIPGFSRETLVAFNHALKLEMGWTGNQPQLGATLCALLATYTPAVQLVERSGVSQDSVQRLMLGWRTQRSMEDARLVHAVLSHAYAQTSLAPLVDTMTTLARRCLLEASWIARFGGEPEVTPFHVGTALLHRSHDDESCSLSNALAYLRLTPLAVEEFLDRRMPHNEFDTGLPFWPRPLASDTLAMLVAAPAIATRIRSDAINTSALLISAAERDEDIRLTLSIRGATPDLLTSAAATTFARVEGQDAVVHLPREPQVSKRAALVEPTPVLTGEAPPPHSPSPRYRELMFRGEQPTGDIMNSDLQARRLRRLIPVVLVNTLLLLLRLIGTITLAAGGNWWLLLTFAGAPLRLTRSRPWYLLAVESLAIYFVPVWLGAIIVVSVISRAVEAWFSLQWRRGDTGDPTYSAKRMRLDSTRSTAGPGSSAFYSFMLRREQSRENQVGSPT